MNTRTATFSPLPTGARARVRSQWQLQPAKVARVARHRGLLCVGQACAEPPSSYSKPRWTNASQCLSDHWKILKQLPSIMGAYVGPAAVDPSLGEKIMLSVNSHNDCPFCTSLHGELARMAGIDEDERSCLLEGEKGGTTSEDADTESTLKEKEDPALPYARTFAATNGQVPEEAEAEMATAYGPEKAASVTALCWFLYWGSLGGNTINALRARFAGTGPKDSSFSSRVFEVAFFAYYGVLFGTIHCISLLFGKLPTVPKGVSAAIGVVLCVCAGVFIFPVGMFGGLWSALTDPNFA
mmetsp:Transcript_25642/g.55719  ORF Transcript_25642/g.55719 Transcript_25642/m.55719 type:complete len:297 (+) Transcript_25642:100-990(+)